MKKRIWFQITAIAVTCVMGASSVAAEEEAPVKAEEQRETDSTSAMDEHRALLERVHAEEMKRLEGMMAVAEERERDDMKTEVAEMIAAAKARHEAALERFGPEGTPATAPPEAEETPAEEAPEAETPAEEAPGAEAPAATEEDS